MPACTNHLQIARIACLLLVILSSVFLLLRQSPGRQTGELTGHGALKRHTGPLERYPAGGEGRPRIHRRRSPEPGPDEPVDATPDVITDEWLNDPRYQVRLERHKRVEQYLNSPARATPECAVIESLCERHGYGVWAVGAAYLIAYEYQAMQERAGAMLALSAGSRQVLEGVQAGMIEALTDDLARRLGVQWDRAFLEAVREVRPTLFFGPLPMAGAEGEPLLDRLEWRAIPPPAAPGGSWP